MVERKHLKKKVILSTTLWETIKIITNKEKKKTKKNDQLIFQHTQNSTNQQTNNIGKIVKNENEMVKKKVQLS